MSDRSFEDRCRWVGSPDQLYSVRRVVMDEGKARGAAFAEVKTGGGLTYQVELDNGLDLGEVSYKGVNVSFLAKPGFHSPYAGYPFETEFLDTFPGGLLYTCGMLSAGPGNVDETTGKYQPMHGRYHNIPADETVTRVVDDNVIEVSGRVREGALFGHSLEMRRTVTSEVGGSEIVVTDVMRNLTPEPVEYMLIYHSNFGYPFLSPELKLTLPEGTQTQPRDAAAAAGLGNERSFSAPIDGQPEEVYFHLQPDNGDGCGHAVMTNAALGIGAEVTYTLGTLPVLAQWKCMKSGEYVLGIEPTNSYIKGRNDERKNGTLPVLEPFGTRTMQVRYRFFTL